MNVISSLGAVHDGDSSAMSCLASDNNIMTPIAGLKGVYKMILTFSSCSINAFKKTLLTSNKY